jgi:tetratricopeptide (TPR) repeat protein
MNVEQAVALAYRHWDASQAGEAEQLCRQVLQAVPGEAGALHLLGLMAHRSGNAEAAINYLNEACKALRAPALYFSNLAEMLRMRGQLAAAEAAARGCVARDDGLAQGWNNLGIILQEAGKYDESLRCLERAGRLNPGNAEICNNLGNTHARLGQLDQAWGHYTQALALRPDYAEAHSNLAAVLNLLGRYREALAHAQKAIALNPRLADAYLNAAGIQRATGALDAALRCVDAMLDFAPFNVRALLLRVELLDAAQRHDEALATCRSAVGLAPDDGAVLLAWARLLQAQGQAEAAMTAVQRAAANLANPAEAHAARAVLLLEAGDLAGALAACDAALQHDPKLATVWLTRAELKKFGPRDPDIQAMQQLAGPGGSQGFTDQLCLNFALGKAFLDHDDAARGFAHLAAGNRMKRSEIDYDGALTKGWMRDIAEQFSAVRLDALRTGGAAGERAVFVIGMPRSGTTLIEQILSAHPAIHGGGERTTIQAMATRLAAETGLAYPNFAEILTPSRLRDFGTEYELSLRASERRIVDKMPSNFFHAGLIHLALPAARIINVRRDAADTCLSCYTKLFAAPQLFAYDLRELGEFYVAYENLMTHWRAVLPASCFIEVQYEDVVAHIEPQARWLIEFCGLEWDDACLRFYETQRIVRTASAAQVRAPLHGGSIGRAARYKRHLAPLFAALEAGP